MRSKKHRSAQHSPCCCCVFVTQRAMAWGAQLASADLRLAESLHHVLRRSHLGACSGRSRNRFRFGWCHHFFQLFIHMVAFSLAILGCMSAALSRHTGHPRTYTRWSPLLPVHPPERLPRRQMLLSLLVRHMVGPLRAACVVRRAARVYMVRPARA